MPSEDTAEATLRGSRAPALHPGAAAVLPAVPVDAVAAINRFSQPRRPLPFVLLDMPGTLRITTLDVPADTALTLCLSVGGEGARLSLSADVLQHLLDSLDSGRALLDEHPAQRAILLEYALLGLITPIEQRLGEPIQVLPTNQPLHDRLPLSLGLWLAFDRGPPTVCRLDLTPGLAGRLADELDRLAPVQPLDMSLVPLVLVVSAGSQTLDVGELESLVPGDVVMLDSVGSEVLIGHRMGAPLDTVDAGFRLAASLAPLLSQKDALMPDKFEDGGISALSVRLVFEFGRAEMTIGDLKKLAPGNLLPLSRPVDDAVDIVANGRRIGRGSLVTIGEGIGVRITRLADDVRPASDE